MSLTTEIDGCLDCPLAIGLPEGLRPPGYMGVCAYTLTEHPLLHADYFQVRAAIPAWCPLKRGEHRSMGRVIRLRDVGRVEGVA